MAIGKGTKVKMGKWDKIWALMVRTRDGKCLVCGSTNTLAAHHFEGRAKKSTRLMLENGITLCASHHVFNHELSAHKTPKDFRNWFKITFPKPYELVEEKVRIMMTERAAIQEFIEKYNLNGK